MPRKALKYGIYKTLLNGNHVKIANFQQSSNFSKIIQRRTDLAMTITILIWIDCTTGMMMQSFLFDLKWLQKCYNVLQLCNIFIQNYY